MCVMWPAQCLGLVKVVSHRLLPCDDSTAPSPHPLPPRQWAPVTPSEEGGLIPGPPVSIPCGGICSPTFRNQGGTAEGEGLFSTFPSTLSGLTPGNQGHRWLRTTAWALQETGEQVRGWEGWQDLGPSGQWRRVASVSRSRRTRLLLREWAWAYVSPSGLSFSGVCSLQTGRVWVSKDSGPVLQQGD